MLTFLRAKRTKEDQEFYDRLQRYYVWCPSTQVVGRGTVSGDAHEILFAAKAKIAIQQMQKSGIDT